MEENTDKLIQEQLKTLPDELQTAILETQWKKYVYEIGKENIFGPDETSILEREVMLVLYGFDDPRKLAENLERELNLNEEEAYALSEKVLVNILEPIQIKAEENQNSTSKLQNSSEVPVIREELAPAVVVERKPTPPPVNLPTNNETSPSIRSWKTDMAEGAEKIERPSVPPPLPQKPLTPVNRYPTGQDPYREPTDIEPTK